MSVLEQFGMSGPPIDPISLASSLGIDVWSSLLDDGVAGMLLRQDRGRPEIYLNRADHSNRQRFTCAHELGHFFQRKLSGDENEWSYVDRRDDLSSRGTDAKERYANAFAAALLMPADTVRENRHLGLSGLAALFEVSEQAMGIRLDGLGLPRYG